MCLVDHVGRRGGIGGDPKHLLDPKSIMTCKQFIDHLLDLTEGELPTETVRLCRQHADLCQECADYLESYQTTIEVEKGAFASPSASLDDASDPDDAFDYALPEDLVQSILSAARAVS